MFRNFNRCPWTPFRSPVDGATITGGGTGGLFLHRTSLFPRCERRMSALAQAPSRVDGDGRLAIARLSFFFFFNTFILSAVLDFARLG